MGGVGGILIYYVVVVWVGVGRVPSIALEAGTASCLTTRSFFISLPFSVFCSRAASCPAQPTALKLWLNVNGEPRQTANVGEMIHTIPKLISHISHKFTLEQGGK